MVCSKLKGVVGGLAGIKVVGGQYIHVLVVDIGKRLTERGNMNEELTKLLDSIAAMAEVTYIFFDRLVSLGFTREEALELAKIQVVSMTMPNTRSNENG